MSSLLDDKGNTWIVFKEDVVYPVVSHLEKKGYRKIVLPQSWYTGGQEVPDVDKILELSEWYFSTGSQSGDMDFYRTGCDLVSFAECVIESSRYFNLCK